MHPILRFKGCGLRDDVQLTWMDVAVPSRYPHRIKYLLIVYIVIVRVTIPKLMGHASRWIFP